MIRRGVGFSRKVLISIERNTDLRRWSGTTAGNASSTAEIGHLLVVKKVEYVPISKVCVESFLHYNPRSKVILHSDEFTYARLLQSFQNRIKSKQVEVRETFVSANLTWQECKVEILLSMNGTSDFFMDADLRWNGPKPSRDGIQFFVQEFDMLDKSPYRQLVRSAMPKYENGTHMRNTSYFSFGGIRIRDAECALVTQFHRNFRTLLGLADLGSADELILSRLSEQIAFSVLADRWRVPIAFLKEVDSHRDGAFVESSYFGATGSSF